MNEGVKSMSMRVAVLFLPVMRQWFSEAECLIPPSQRMWI